MINNSTTVMQGASVAASNRCMSGRVAKVKLSKKARKGSIRYLGKSGLRTAKARKAGGRLSAKADFRGVDAEAGTYSAVTVREKTSGGWRESTRLFKLC